MEQYRSYTDPHDENDVTNKRYVDNNIYNIDKKIDDSIKTSMKYADDSIKTTINNINDGKLIFDNIYTNNIKTSNILDLNKAFVRSNEGVNISINSRDIVLSATTSAETLFGRVELIDLRGLEGKSITIAWDFDTNRDDLKKYFNYLRPEIWYYNPKTGERENLTWGFLNGNSITIRENLNDYYLLEVVFFLTNVYTTAHVDADFKIGDWVAYKNLQINIGTKKLPYTPFKRYGYNSQESMGSIVVDDISCKNLFNASQIHLRTENGVTISRNSKGGLILNGTATSQIEFFYTELVNESKIKSGNTYTLSSNTLPQNNLLQIFLQNSNGNTWVSPIANITGDVNPDTFTVPALSGTHFKYLILILKGATFDNFVIYPQIEEGTVATNYSEYKGIGYTNGKKNGVNWVKYDDGRMELWGEVTMLANNENVVINFPFPFNSPNDYSIFATPGYNYHNDVICTWADKGWSSCRIFAVRSDRSIIGYDQSIDFQIKGYWK